MALTINRVAPIVITGAFLAIASLAMPKEYVRKEPSPEIERVRDLRKRVSSATLRLEALTRRDSVLASLPTNAATSRTRAVLALDPRLPATHRSMIERGVQRQWKSLGIDSAKVPVVVSVIVDTALAQTAFGVDRGEYTYDYVVPTSTDAVDERRCVTIVALHSRSLVRPDRQRELSDLLASPNSASRLLGPCAFLARFGVAGPAIDRWLRTRNYDLAAYPRWYALPADTRDIAEQWRVANTNNDLALQAGFLSPEAIGCAAGTLSHCATTLSADANADNPESANLVMMTMRRDRHWWTLAPRYVSDLATALGPEKFGQFWRSNLPPDAALRVVAGRSLDVWTRQWAVGLIGDQRVGPAASLAEILWAVSVVALSVVAAAWGWTRRQVG